jgi:hypothetical protein
MLHTHRLENLKSYNIYAIGRGVLSIGLKRQGRESDYLSPTSADIKEMWIYASILPTYVFTE